MRRFRALFFLMIIMGVTTLTIIFVKQPVQPPFSRSLATLFQEVGKPVKTVDRAISHILPVGEIDEKMLGDEIKKKLSNTLTPKEEDDPSIKYLNSLVHSLTDETHKPFEYTVFLVEGSPNAFAMPGGIICITKELMRLLQSEAELVAILGHEIGHIERGHLFDAARGEMLRRKVEGISLAAFAFDSIYKIMDLTFNKSQEDEADEYGFRLLVKKGYDPFAMSTGFEKLAHHSSHNHHEANLIDDFFKTHPYTELRFEKFLSRAKLWKANYPDARGYVGKKNLANRITHFEESYSDEWSIF